MPARPHTDRWEGWLDEFERHPLDRFEYEAMLLCRDDVEEEAEIVGQAGLFDRIDELDARFADVTVEGDLPFPALGDGWWWRRIPADPGARAYLLR